MAKRKNPRNNNVETKITASEAPAAEAASEAPAAEAASEAPAESGVITLSIPGCEDRSYQFKLGTTWGKFMKENGISLKPGWRAMISGKVINAKTRLQSGSIIKVANKPKNG